MKHYKLFISLGLSALMSVSIPAQAAEKSAFMDRFKKKTEPQQASQGVAASAKEQTKQVFAPPAAPVERDMPAVNRTALTNRMANNKTMTDAEKKDLAETMVRLFPATADFNSADYEKHALFFEQISNDPNMKVAEKKAEIQKHFSESGAIQANAPQKIEAPLNTEASPIAKTVGFNKTLPAAKQQAAPPVEMPQAVAPQADASQEQEEDWEEDAQEMQKTPETPEAPEASIQQAAAPKQEAPKESSKKTVKKNNFAR